MLKKTLLTLLLVFCFEASSDASAHRYRTISGSCAVYKCSILGIPRYRCQNWRIRNRCYVRVRLTRYYTPRGRSNYGKGRIIHGHPDEVIFGGRPVRTARCPYSCRSLGIPKYRCRDWRRGNQCYVQY